VIRSPAVAAPDGIAAANPKTIEQRNFAAERSIRAHIAHPINQEAVVT
jgi:hypothetical protein